MGSHGTQWGHGLLPGVGWEGSAVTTPILPGSSHRVSGRGPHARARTTIPIYLADHGLTSLLSREGRWADEPVVTDVGGHGTGAIPMQGRCG